MNDEIMISTCGILNANSGNSDEQKIYNENYNDIIT